MVYIISMWMLVFRTRRCACGSKRDRDLHRISLRRLWQPQKKGNGKERKKTWIGNTHVISRCYGNLHGQEDIPEADDLIPKGEISHSSHSQPLLSGLVTSRVGKCLCICWKVPVLISLISRKLNFLSFFFFLCLYVLKAQGDNVIYFPSDQGKKNLVFFM